VVINLIVISLQDWIMAVPGLQSNPETPFGLRQNDLVAIYAQSIYLSFE
jgi:hypothetical protein